MKKMKKYLLLLSVLMVSVVFAAQASADLAYTVVDSTYTSGSFGLLKETDGYFNTQKEVVTSLNGDHAVYSFMNAAGKQRVMISQYTKGQPDTVSIYDPESGWKTPIERQWTDFSNKRAAAALDNYLYAIGYDNAKLVRVDMAGEIYNQDKVYDNYVAETGYTAHGEGVIAFGGHVYGLFSEVKGTYPNFEYSASKVVKFDKDLNVIATAYVGKNAVKMLLSEKLILIVSIGGSQNNGSFNKESKIEMLQPDSMIAEDLLKAEDINKLNSSWKYDFRDIAVSEEHRAFYILAGAYNSDWSFNSRIYKASLDDFRSKKPGSVFADTSGSGSTWQILYDKEAEKVVCLAGNQVNIYNPNNGADVQKVTTQDLGGNLCSAAIIKKVSSGGGGNDDSGGGSGCNAGFAGLLLLASVPAIGLARGKKR